MLIFFLFADTSIYENVDQSNILKHSMCSSSQSFLGSTSIGDLNVYFSCIQIGIDHIVHSIGIRLTKYLFISIF